MSVLLAVIMLLGMTIVSASAMEGTGDGGSTEPNFQLTVPADDGHTYEVYQIFTGDLSGDSKDNYVLSNIKWGQNGTGTQGAGVDTAIITELEEVNADGKTDAEKLKVIRKYWKESSEAFTTITKGGSQAVPAGYYLIKDADSSVGDDDTDNTYTTYIVEVVGDVAIHRKSGVPEVEKKVTDVNDSVAADPDVDNDAQEENRDSADYDIGDSIPFTLTATLAENVSGYKTYYLQFEDTMSKGLTFNKDSVSVQWARKGTDNYQDVPTDYYTIAKLEDYKSDESKTDNDEYVGGKVLKITFDNVKSIVGDERAAELDGATIRVNYTATLNNDAVIGKPGNPNKVKLHYSRDPNTEGGGEPGETPEDKNVIFTFEVIVNKVDEEKNPLVGAGFTLYKKYAEAPEGGTVYTGDDSYYLVEEIKASEATKFTFTGLDAGEYLIVESETPSGYNTIEPIPFKVIATHTDDDDIGLTVLKVVDSNGKDLNNFIIQLNKPAADNDNDDGYQSGDIITDIENRRGSMLPSTGGIGTTIFYVVGGVLVVAAGVVLVVKKRAGAAK